jgi:hypothetical protein
MSHLTEVGRVHVNRWAGTAHLDVWFMSSTRGLTGVLGSFAAEWKDLLPLAGQPRRQGAHPR